MVVCVRVCECVSSCCLRGALSCSSSGCRMWAPCLLPLRGDSTPSTLSSAMSTYDCTIKINSFQLIGYQPSLLLAPVWVCQKHSGLSCWKRCSREVKGHFRTCACAARWGGGRQHPEPSWSPPREWSWPAGTQRGWGQTKEAGPGEHAAAGLLTLKVLWGGKPRSSSITQR